MIRRLTTLLAALGIAAALAAAGPRPAMAQSGSAVLVADRVELDGRNRVVATGNVEALRDGTRLQARRIVYDRTGDKLYIEGPIVLTEETGRAVIIADSAALDADLRNGLVRGARMMLDQQVQLASYQLNRIEGRYTQLYKATVTSCHVCDDGTPPLWQIRARRVVHDQTERQLYFEDARFEVVGIPIFWLPRMRFPDPTQDRATGFLIPSLRRNSETGTGVKVPYFITLGQSRDLTLTPYVSDRTRTLEARYRQAFRTGRIEFNGAISDDDIRPGDIRGFISGGGSFRLPRDFRLEFDIEATTDAAYPTEYDYSDKDRLDSEVSVIRVRRDEFIRGAITSFRTLRVNEDNNTIPAFIGNVTYERRFFPARFGGEFRLGAEAHSHLRWSDRDTDGPDPDTIVDGRDVGRLSVDAAYHRTETLPLGLRLGMEFGVSVDAIRTGQDSTLPASDTGIAPRTGITLRWPWSRRGGDGSVNIIEPVAQFAWTGGQDLTVANEESTRVEFDEGNLLAMSRFPSTDRRERGRRAAIGLNWSRFTATGWQNRVTLGQIVREDNDGDFHLSSGLSGRSSDLLVAGQITSPENLAFTARAIFRDRRDLTKAEARASWITPKVAIGASYLWLDDDPQENRPDTLSEWSIDSTFRVTENVLLSASWRYDLLADATAEAGFGIAYINECVEMEFSASRRFTSSTIVQPSTEFSFSIGLRGFSAKAGGQRFTRTCK
ncbi:organic solvent tolerance protein [Oceanicola sp. 22II-s10i]|uniref:LPS-assembly protein LptD n=1 Tax=Oceanicola sp. 22II-s10i TaxID=1317116 RepID=UPI000B520A63|nr:LPS assembly protein LptD [Oceanicola sp. 22II-s10i]OWU84864.1 organic solvent tolerance protein [Oceanicola sp. 22II-s10i]